MSAKKGGELPHDARGGLHLESRRAVPVSGPPSRARSHTHTRWMELHILQFFFSSTSRIRQKRETNKQAHNKICTISFLVCKFLCFSYFSFQKRNNLLNWTEKKNIKRACGSVLVSTGSAASRVNVCIWECASVCTKRNEWRQAAKKKNMVKLATWWLCVWDFCCLECFSLLPCCWLVPFKVIFLIFDIINSALLFFCFVCRVPPECRLAFMCAPNGSWRRQFIVLRWFNGGEVSREISANCSQLWMR